jgi:predicted permease
MKPGVTLEQANAQLLAVSGPILHETSTDGRRTADEESHHFHFDAEPGSRGFTYARALFSKPLTVMFCMCGGILLLACLNLTSLLMARGAARQQELATRLAMGATRSRLVQQLLVESLLIAIVGTALGMGASPLVSHSLGAMLAGSNVGPSVVLDTSMDMQVFFFAALTAMIAALLIGLVPALRATGGELNEQIKEGQHTTRTQERRRVLPRVLMSIQVALALVLVTGAGLLATSLVRLYASGAGFDPHGLVSIANSMDKQQLAGEPLMQLYQQMDEGLKRLPGMKSVSLQFIVPLSHAGWDGDFAAPGGAAKSLMLNGVAPDYFSTMRIPMYAGREFAWSDTPASGLKIVLNETAAKLLFPSRNAVGQQLKSPEDKRSYEVVAVVGDAKYSDMRSAAPAQGYIPIMQMTAEDIGAGDVKPNLHTIVRVDGDLAPLASAVKSLTAQLVPGIPAPEFMTMDELMDNSLGAERMMAVLALFFAGCALLVTAIGLYGTLAYATARRTNEIGIRMALGAARAQVVAMVFRENAIVAGVGCGAGLVVAVFASKVLASLLYGTSAHDPWVLIGSVAMLALIASAASLLPALRAARTDPMAAIRCE